MNVTKLDLRFYDCGLNAVCAHPKARLYANVNHEDNFSLAMMGTARDAIMDVVCRELEKKPVLDWFNAKSTKGRWDKYTPLDQFVRDICREAYHQLR